MTSTFTRSTAAALGFYTALTAPALADFTAQEVFDAVTGAFVQSGLRVSAQGLVLQSGDNVIITELTIGDGDGAVTIPTAELRAVDELDDGVFLIGEVYMPAQTINVDNAVTVTLGDISISDLKAATADSGYSALDNGYYSAAAIDGIAFTKSGNDIFSADALNVTLTPFNANQPISSSMTIDRMLLNTAAFDDRRARETMKALGYEQIRGDVVANGAWDPRDGRLALTDMTLSAQDAADLTLTLELLGYTTEVAEAMRALQAQMTPDNEQAGGMAMLGLLQQLEFKSMRLTLKDESLTGRILDFVAAQQGMDRPAITAMAKGLLPIGLAQLQAPAFAAAAQQAIGAYLDDPDTLTISATPESPVPFALLMGPVMTGNQQALLDALNVTITAND